MAAIIFTGLDFTGSPDPEDQAAARYIVAAENARRTARNVELAAQTPPGTPLAMLPTGTGAQLKASYIAVLLDKNVQGAHASYIQQAKSASAVEQAYTAAELDAIRAAIIAQKNAGLTAAQLTAKISA